MKLGYFDLETFSPIPLRDGTHIYSAAAEVMIVTWAVEGGAIQVWDRTADKTMPAGLIIACNESDEYWWQNGGMFDLVLLKNCLPELFALMPLHKWRDTMAQALAHGLPGGLDILGQIFGLGAEDAKFKSGRNLIHLFCKPLPKNQTLRRATRLTHPKEWADFIEYAKQDIVAMRILNKKMPSWNYPNNKFELDLWHRDLALNLRGVAVDTELAATALTAIEKEQKKLAAQAKEQTFDDIESATQRDKLLAHVLLEYGIQLPDMKKATLERRVRDENLPLALRTLLALRLEASMTSTSKYKTLLKGVSADGRLRGLQQFCGAARTGRWAHRLFQPGNLPRYDVKLITKEMRCE